MTVPIEELVALVPTGEAPMVVGIGGAVASGKSRLAADLAAGLAASGRTFAVVSADGFLLSNETLASKGLTDHKGWPETWRWDAIAAAIDGWSAGNTVDVPLYSHDVYDVLAETQAVAPGDGVILEGLPVVMKHGPPLAFDLRICLEATNDQLQRWFTNRFYQLVADASPGSFYAGFAKATSDELAAIIDFTWQHINRPNIDTNVRPAHDDADVIISKAHDHHLVQVLDLRA